MNLHHSHNQLHATAPSITGGGVPNLNGDIFSYCSPNNAGHFTKRLISLAKLTMQRSHSVSPPIIGVWPEWDLAIKACNERYMLKKEIAELLGVELKDKIYTF